MPVFYPNQKLPVTEIEILDDINADSPDGFYIQEGGTSTPSGDTTIHYYDSLDQVPADLPDGSFVAVPSDIISLNEYGIDLISFLLSGGGVMSIEGAQVMFDLVAKQLDAGKTPTFIAMRGDSPIYLTPILIENNSVSFNFVYYVNALMEAVVHIYNNTHEARIIAFVETHTT